MTNKMPVDVDALVKELRNKHRAYVLTDNAKAGEIFRIAADVIAEFKRKEKFTAFIWNTLGHDTMRQLIEMYREREDEE